MLFQFNDSEKTIRCYSRYIISMRRKTQGKKQIVQPTQKERKEKKRRKKRYSTTSVVSFFFNFPLLLFFSLYSTRIYVCVCIRPLFEQRRSRREIAL